MGRTRPEAEFIIFTGVGMAILCTVWVGLLGILSGGTVFRALSGTYLTFVAVCFAGSLLASLIVAALWPLTRRMAGAAFVGYMAVLLFLPLVSLPLLPPGDLKSAGLSATPFVSFLGAFVGIALWIDSHPSHRAARPKLLLYLLLMVLVLLVIASAIY